MKPQSLNVRITKSWGAAAVILMATLSCDSMAPEPTVPVLASPRVPQTPEQPPVPIERIMRGQVVFVDQSTPSFLILLGDSNGAPLQNLSLGASDDFDPTVSVDGKKIAFSSHVRTEDGRDIWVMNADGTNRVRLTHTVKATSWNSSTDPAWSPDGKRIAFVTSTGIWEHQIFVMNADGSDVRQLTDDDNAYNLAPEWSPDGSRILFSHVPNRPENNGIFEMDPDGSNARQLTSGYAYAPTRSPDATRIAFISGQSLFVVNADGSNKRTLTSDVDWTGEISWSPDGESIVFGIASNSKMCLDWNYDWYACGRDLKRVGLDGVIDPSWGVISGFSLVWQR